VFDATGNEVMRQFIFIAAVALAGLGVGGARAQDPYAAAPPARFGGLEAGAEAGGAVGGAGSVSTSGIGVGGYAGYNFQSGQLVGGVEGDTLAGSINGNGRGGTMSQNWLTSLRVRGGWAFGNVLAYATIGPAWATSDFQTGGFTASKTVNGLTYGAGGEFALTQSFTARAEVRHYDLGTSTYYLPAGAQKLSNGNNLLLVGVGAHF
jgi:outer membrane immunogenic protein